MKNNTAIPNSWIKNKNQPGIQTELLFGDFSNVKLTKKAKSEIKKQKREEEKLFQKQLEDGFFPHVKELREKLFGKEIANMKIPKRLPTIKINYL